jgi:UDP-N-acetylglucosamine 1-carboxyvinyltransferase
MSERIIIRGGNRLTGEVEVSGAKNAAVAILPAALLCGGECIIDNLPYINDVIVLENMLNKLGAKATLSEDGSFRVDASNLNTWKTDFETASRMRASYYLLGVLLARFGKAEVPMPGGCDIGARPVDQHQKALEALGAMWEVRHGIIYVEAEKLTGAEIYMDCISVGATINTMLAAVLAEGTTTIVNAAKEPHVVDVASFLNAMGANVKGAGTDTIRVRGVNSLHGCQYSIIPDQIEAGTLMIAAAATGGDVVVNNVIPTHMDALSAKLAEAGAKIVELDSAIRVSAEGQLKAVTIKTLPYPGFPTDLQQPFTAMLSVSKGTGVVVESIYEDRFKHVFELRRMGADITVNSRVAVVNGVDFLSGALVRASDLRAGAALIIAGLIAQGETTVRNVRHIDRGYYKMEEKLISLGADITRVRE